MIRADTSKDYDLLREMQNKSLFYDKCTRERGKLLDELDEKDKIIKKLKLENEKLNYIINKTKEYIKKYELISGYYDSCYDDEYDTYSNNNVKEELLGILSEK